jgi:hypothetical protein
MQTENLADLVNIAASLKHKYSMVPFAVAVQGKPIPNALLSDGYDAAQQTNEPAAGLAAPAQSFGLPQLAFPKPRNSKFNFTLDE